MVTEIHSLNKIIIFLLVFKILKCPKYTRLTVLSLIFRGWNRKVLFVITRVATSTSLCEMFLIPFKILRLLLWGIVLYSMSLICKFSFPNIRRKTTNTCFFYVSSFCLSPSSFNPDVARNDSWPWICCPQPHAEERHSLLHNAFGQFRENLDIGLKNKIAL